ncbi:hypothetical protein HYPSUDRAFT_57429 [Hypholoma sublateritium FD-334 SS-4]|uniref:Protein-S-isoprenylcysteine O-methyltransferase n=1 Tax=Hypholoma sublateritium (strain FD-334 SS-4) TaxID=945553 RepID=A0A0D2M410_HYPSF|nr:hypothetical protein HYPSUDRAFT_57429 [Hypholoma sublateritium FD-334 SS-4]
MSISKIPLVVLFSFAYKRCITPPNPAAPKAERISNKTLNTTWYTQNMLRYARLLAGLAEVAIILAANSPDEPLSKLILDMLLFEGGNAANLRLTPATLAGGLMMIAGTLIRVVTFRYLGQFFRFEASIQKDHQLITGGPYAIVRHPSYTGLLISHVGWFLWQFGEGSWVLESGLWRTLLGKLGVLAFTVLVILGSIHLTFGRMSSEDRALQERFGPQWDRWASRVRYMVVPGVY